MKKKRFYKEMNKVVSLKTWHLIILIAFAVVAVGLISGLASYHNGYQTKSYDIQKGLDAAYKEGLMNLPLSEVQDWGMKRLIITGVYAAPILTLGIFFVLFIHGFKIFGR